MVLRKFCKVQNSNDNILKGIRLGLKQFLLTEGPLKMMVSTSRKKALESVPS